MFFICFSLNFRIGFQEIKQFLYYILPTPYMIRSNIALQLIKKTYSDFPFHAAPCESFTNNLAQCLKFHSQYVSSE